MIGPIDRCYDVGDSAGVRDANLFESLMEFIVMRWIDADDTTILRGEVLLQPWAGLRLPQFKKIRGDCQVRERDLGIER